jgi:Flp pilus assembly protein TadB
MCWHSWRDRSERMSDAADDARGSFGGSLRRVSTADADLRVSDAERDSVVESLRRHTTAGRITAEELEQRVADALRARTRGELAPLVADLPGRRLAPRSSAGRRRPISVPLLVLMLTLVTIWLITGAGTIWPVAIIAFVWMPRHGHHHRGSPRAQRL